MIDLNELTRRLLESCLNTTVELQADEFLGEGNRRSDYRIHTLYTCVGTLTLRMLKLREGTSFSNEILKPYLRVDRIMAATIAGTYKLGLSQSEIEKAAAKLKFGELSLSTVSRTCVSL